MSNPTTPTTPTPEAAPNDPRPTTERLGFNDLLRIGHHLKRRGCIAKGMEHDAMLLIGEWAAALVNRETRKDGSDGQ
jgi:hypothetical protein